MPKRFLISCVLALVTVACGAATPTIPTTTAPQATQAPTAMPVTTSTSTTTPAAANDRLFIREGYGTSTDRLSVMDARSGTRLRDMPFGVSTPDWSVLYTTPWDAEQTIVRALNPLTGQTIRETSVSGRYALPEVGIAGTFGGLSPNGNWLALERKPGYAIDATDTSQARSHLVVLDTAFAQAPKRVELVGNFAFDAVSNNGASLYLIETLPRDSASTPGLGYKVRLYDLTTGALQPGVVVDKTAIAETMSGTRHSSIISTDGQWVYSLYLNQAKGPFIHMLNLDGRFAICVFLPTTGKEDFEKQLLWSLAQTKDGRSLYAVNGALGIVADVDPAQLSVRRSVTIPTMTASQPNLVARVGTWLLPHASAKRILSGGATLTPDGRTLFIIAEQGLLAVNTADLTVRGRSLADWPLDSITMSPDGARLYAVSAEKGKLLLLDTATGKMIKEIAGASRPWSILGVG